MAKTQLKVLIHASELLTGLGVRLKEGKRPQEEDLGRIEDGALVYEVKKRGGREVPGQVVWVGKTSDLPKKYSRLKKKDLKGKSALVPGFVDCHTHLVFAGHRAQEFAERCAGATYEEIAKKGGGILSTVRATREASEGELFRLAKKRLLAIQTQGVRTIEIKSGYGLSFDSEMKILRVVKKLQEAFPELTIVPTFLGAHAFPPELTRTQYLEDLIQRQIPQVARQKLATSCDVFMDRGYYSEDETRSILDAARSWKLAVRLHADELANTGAAELAVSYSALSADHLLKVSHSGIQALAASQTVAVLLPGTAFYLKYPYAPARKLIEAGVPVALATDFNPGTCMIWSLPVIMTLAALYLGMTRAEIFAAVTYNGAKALGLDQTKGTLAPGFDADFTILNSARFEDVYYSWTLGA